MPGAAKQGTVPGLVGAVLAGGLSSRLGHDKAVLHLESGTSADLLARSVGLLRCFCERVVVVGRKQPGYECLPDLRPGYGPVGGIATVLAHFHCPCLVLSCDLPFMEEAVLERLIAAREERPPDALVTAYRQHDTGHVEALVAIYEAGAQPFFRECMEKKLLKITLVTPQERQHYLYYSAEDSLPFFNINYPADLEVARRMMHMLGRG